MVRKQIDNRIRVLIENGVKLGHRTLFVIVGDKGKDQIVLLHHMLLKAEGKVRPSILWCYKKELGFNSHRKKRLKQIQHKLKSGSSNVNEEDPFDLFISSTKIRFSCYSDSHKILGNTYGMLVLQDFEALTPNLLARTIETVEGGGIIVILLHTFASLKQFYTLNMDVHQRFRTEAHDQVVCHFNERFLLSLISCKRSLVVDDQMTVLPITSRNLQIVLIEKVIEPTKHENELAEMKISLSDTPHVGCLINCCKTLDQAVALMTFIDAITEKTISSTVSLTAARGRGKSAVLGLSVAAAVAFGYSNVFVTSPTPENLNTFFEFVCKGFDALKYEENLHYVLVQSTNPDFNKSIVRINIFKEHRQTIQYIHPTDSQKLSQAELLVIDEAAAIPLPFVKELLGKYLVFLASTINGYEGTGRSLSLKLLQQLRSRVVPVGTNPTTSNASGTSTGKTLKEITLEESIRYKSGDKVETWLTKLLCLDATSVMPTRLGYPAPDFCDLYYINRETLFSYHSSSEAFLQRLVALFVASHYKNSPNDLQMMSDAPAHHLFCLCGPNPDQSALPEILVAIQICLEGAISKNSIEGSFSRGKGAAGDLIPWTVTQQFLDPNFAGLPGARIVRIATHPDYQKMGYGTRALTLLKQYYEFKFPNVEEDDSKEKNEAEKIMSDDLTKDLLKERIEPKPADSLPSLLLKLSDRTPEKLRYLGVSFGLTETLLKFWKRSDFVPVYIRQTTNDLTAEHSCIMLNVLKNEEIVEQSDDWLLTFYVDFRRRFISLLSYEFQRFSTALAYGILKFNLKKAISTQNLTFEELNIHVTKYDMKRLEMYSNNLVDYHLIMDLIPTLAKLFFQEKMGNIEMSSVQSAILLAIGLQHKSVDKLASELDLPPTQILALFNRLIKRCYQYLNSIVEDYVDKTIGTRRVANLVPVAQDLDVELEEAAKKLQKQQKKELQKLKNEDLEKFTVKGSEEEWGEALSVKGSKNLLSIKVGVKRRNEKTGDEKDDNAPDPIKKKTKRKKFNR